MRKIFVFIFLASFNLFSQDLLDGNKIWYSTYLNKKINNRIFIDDYALTSFNAKGHSFSFFQNDLAFNYRQNRFLTFVFMYSHSMYNWNLGYKNVYTQSISKFNTISFNRFAIGVNYDLKINRSLDLKQYLTFQYYTPQLEKYQMRIKYDARISYVFKKSKNKIKPFITQSFFYYLNGEPNFYYNEDGTVNRFASPNGIHRSRTKFGVSFRPIKNVKELYFVAYYTVQKEFNLGSKGNGLNIYQPSKIESSLMPNKVVIPFNNYSVYGFQLNYFF